MDFGQSGENRTLEGFDSNFHNSVVQNYAAETVGAHFEDRNTIYGV